MREFSPETVASLPVCGRDGCLKGNHASRIIADSLLPRYGAQYGVYGVR